MTQRRLLIVLTLLASLAAVAEAQRGGSRGGRRGTARPDWDAMANNASSTPITRKELEAMDPVRHLLGERKELKLTDDQVTQLKALDDAGKAEDAPLLSAADSLRKEVKPAGEMDDIKRLRAQVAREELAKTVAQLRTNQEARAAKALPLLDDAQRPVATKLIEELDAETKEVLAEKVGGGAPPARRP